MLEGGQFMPAKIENVWSCYRGCHFNGRENGHVTEVVTLWRENGHVMEKWSV